MDPSAALEKARERRRQIHERLTDEEETELAGLLEKCGQPLRLICSSCGHAHHCETKCRQKWCPVCVRAIATKRSMKFAAAAAAMQWPLFITLTVENIGDAGIPFVRKLRRDFGKLRHRRIWKDNVLGGVAAIEITNKGNGWHPHLHALVDCKWLASKTPPPQFGASKREWQRRCKAAHREFVDVWKKVTKSKHGVCWITRAKSKNGLDAGSDTAREVLKYSVKGSDLAESPDPIGPLIHQLRATRLTTSFGTLFGKHLVRADNERPPQLCEGCGLKPEWIPDYVADAIIRKRR